MALLPVLAGMAFVSMSPAQAQYYVRPFGGVYVERYYEPLPPAPPPVYYGAPPAYGDPMYRPPGYRPPAYRAPGRFPYSDIQPMLRSMGMTAIGRARADGDTYVVDATDRQGMRVRVRLDAFNGRVIAMRPLGAAAVAGRSAPPPPGVAPLPPKRPPELAAVGAPAPAPTAEPQDAAPAMQTAVPPEPESAPAAAAPPSTEPPVAATPPAEPAPSEPDAIRVIPGIAVPPGSTGSAPAKSPPPPDQQAKAVPAQKAAPADEAAGTGTGTGTGTGSDTPAGTASVMARGTASTPNAGKPDGAPPVAD